MGSGGARGLRGFGSCVGDGAVQTSWGSHILKTIVTRNKAIENLRSSRNLAAKHPDLRVPNLIRGYLHVSVGNTCSSFVFQTKSGTGYPDVVAIAVENTSRSALWEINSSGRIRDCDNVGSSGAPSFCKLF